jgi:hypothetical protein
MKFEIGKKFTMATGPKEAQKSAAPAWPTVTWSASAVIWLISVARPWLPAAMAASSPWGGGGLDDLTVPATRRGTMATER